MIRALANIRFARLLLRSLPVRLILASALLSFSGIARAEPVYPANGVIGLEPPEGMTEAPNFAGFASDEGASIVIVEMPPEAFEHIAAKFNAEGLASQMTVEGTAQKLTLNNDVQALLVQGRQSAHGTAFRKWALLARSPATTALVTVQIPGTDTRYSDADILASLKSLRIRSSVSIEAQIEALPFTIGDRASFRPVRTLAGSSLILTDGPANSYKDGSQPIAIIAASMGSDRRFAAMSAEERGQLAHRLAEQLSYTELTLKNVPGSEDSEIILTGTAIDPKREQQVSLRQILRFSDTGYVRIVCIAKPEQSIAARCDRIAQSVVSKGSFEEEGG